MKRAEDMVADARRKERDREGVWVKAKLPDRLAERVGRCAADAGEPFGQWVLLACILWSAGKFAGVDIPRGLKTGAGGGSAARWVRVPAGFDRRGLRVALAAAVCWCAARRKPGPSVPPSVAWRVDGRDYFV